MLIYNNLKYTWNHGGLIDNPNLTRDEDGNIRLDEILDGFDNCESICKFIIRNIITLDNFNYLIMGNIVLLFDYLQVNFIKKFAKHLIDNKINFPDITFPPYISMELTKHPKILSYIAINKIINNNIVLTKEYEMSDELLLQVEQTPNMCITEIDCSIKWSLRNPLNNNHDEIILRSYESLSNHITELEYSRDSFSCIPHMISDNGLQKCIFLKKLNATNNFKIKSCMPFANTLTELDASYSCKIDDEELKACKKLKILIARYNKNITTCEPFADTLIKLIATFDCNISDKGLKKCNKLQILEAQGNPRITKCYPFAKTLTHLTACLNCGISDADLIDCVNLQYLEVYDNPKITMHKLVRNSSLYHI
jgi:hypothetical protein